MSSSEKPLGYIQTTFEFVYPVEPIEQEQLRKLHEGVAPYLDSRKLRRLAAAGSDINEALRSTNPPDEILALVEAVRSLLRPRIAERIRSPADVAALLMVEMGSLDQEELRTVLLDTKNRVQDIVTIYRGSLNSSLVRVGEVYKEALRRNSAAIIVAHNHPSSDVTPSPEDVLVTREIVQAGNLLDVECLDHLVIGQGKWLSMRERGLGFNL